MTGLRIALAVVAVLVLGGALAHAGERPLYYDRPITRADLDGRTLRELSLIRNMIFARAGQPFRKQWLRDYFTKQTWYKPVDVKKVAKVPELDAKNAAFVAKYEAEIPKEELERRRADLAAGKTQGMTPDEAKIEERLVSRALGGASKADAEAVKADPTASPLDDPRELDRQLTVDQLKDLSRRDLRILRNMVYARRGRAFKSPLLQEYFGRMEWYQVDPGYSDKSLSKIDQRNIKIIRSVEDQVGGPMTDDEQKKEDGWFGGA